jgi:hypothetical protein
MKLFPTRQRQKECSVDIITASWLIISKAHRFIRDTEALTMGHQASQSVAYTISGAKKSVVASIEPKEPQERQKSTNFSRDFRRSPAPSPPSLEERKEFEDRQTKNKDKAKLESS